MLLLCRENISVAQTRTENYYVSAGESVDHTLRSISSIPPNRVSNQARGHIMEALNQASIAVLRALNAANDAPIEDIDDGYGEHDAVSRWIEQMERTYA